MKRSLCIRTSSLVAVVVLLSFAAVSQQAQAEASPPIDTSLPNGLRIIVQQEQNTRLVAINVFVRTSAPEDLQDAGTGNFVAAALLSGTTNEDENTMETQIANLGGNVHAVWQADMTQIQALTVSDQFDESAYLLSDVLKNATFPSDAVNEARQDLLERKQSESDDLFSLAYDNLRSVLYSGTPFAATSIGDPSVIERLTPTDLENYFQRYYRPDRIVISVVGNVDPAHAVNEFQSELSDFPRLPLTPERTTTFRHASAPVSVKRFRGDLRVGVIMAGYAAPATGSADYAAMQVTNALLGGMKTSLLFTNLRDVNSYGYEVASIYQSQPTGGDISAYIITSPVDNSSTKQASFATIRQALEDQFQILSKDPPTEDKLERAKKFLIGSYLLQHERILDRAYYLGYSETELKSLGGYRFDTHYADFINAVTASDVQRVARTYFTGNPYLSMLLPGDPNAGVINE